MAHPFFLDAAQGRRFALFHAPAGTCRGALLYLHPFAEEMNKARRMAALAARALAAHGIGVLQLDLHGCGDSSGDFGDARWDIWLDDAALGHAWLRERLGQPVGLWGLRAGALLALDAARRVDAAQLLLWSPVLSGATFLNQFLRLRMAAEMMGEGTGSGAQALRARLRAGETLEIAGYDLHPAMADALEARDAIELAAAGRPVHWFDLQSADGKPLMSAAARVAAAWQEAGVDLRLHPIAGPQFWATQEIEEAPALIAATVEAMQ